MEVPLSDAAQAEKVFLVAGVRRGNMQRELSNRGSAAKASSMHMTTVTPI
jgi:hypothetical protein